MLSVAIAYVVSCNCLCCPLQLPMLSVAIAYVVILFKTVHTMCIPISTTTALNPKPSTPPPNRGVRCGGQMLQLCGGVVDVVGGAVVFALTPRGSRAMDMFITTCVYTSKKVHTPIRSITVYTLKLFVFAEIAGSQVLESIKCVEINKMCCDQ
jgi:hypothetical protein